MESCRIRVYHFLFPYPQTDNLKNPRGEQKVKVQLSSLHDERTKVTIEVTSTIICETGDLY